MLSSCKIPRPPCTALSPTRRSSDLAVSYRVNTNGDFECSRPFDPVGPDAPNDSHVVPQLFFLRALIGDEGNAGVGSNVSFVAGVDTVTMFILSDNSRPLVVDSDGDGTCDAINPNVIPQASTSPGPSQAIMLGMVPIPPRGSGDFTGTYATPSGCGPGGDPKAPKPLCLQTNLPPGMTIAIQDSDKAPLIWTLPPVVNNNY